MLAVALDLPGKRVFAVEPDRDDMRILGVGEIEMARDAAIIAHVLDLGDITLVRKTPHRMFL